MPEGLLGGVLGADDDKPEVEAPRTLANAEAYAAAVAAIASHHDPGVALGLDGGSSAGAMARAPPAQARLVD